MPGSGATAFQNPADCFSRTGWQDAHAQRKVKGREWLARTHKNFASCAILNLVFAVAANKPFQRTASATLICRMRMSRKVKCREWLARTHENIASTAILDLDFVAAEKSVQRTA